MKYILFCVLCLSLTSIAFSGDDASGPINYRTDLSINYTQYQLTEDDKAWGKSLVDNFKYKGNVFHFVKTSIPLYVNDSVVQGGIYRALELEGVFYVINGDTIIDTNKNRSYSPGVGGFSMHAPKSKNFIVCLNFNQRGVPHLSSSPVRIGHVTWKGNNWKRIK